MNDAGRTGVYQDGNAKRPADPYDVLCAADVDAFIVFAFSPYTCLASGMDDGLTTTGGLRKRLLVANITPVYLDVPAAEVLCTAALKSSHLVTKLAQLSANRSADESATAGDENLH